METEFCPNCFQKLAGPEARRLCPHCGFDLAANPQPQNALPWNTLLHSRYRMGRVLGQGGFGITYIGFDTNLQCKVAIKEYYPQGVVVRDAGQSHSLTWPASPSVKGKESGCESFLREARKMARIGSIPGIVRVIDTFTENETSYIIMDYLEGVTLRQYIRANGPMTFTRCLDMLRPLFGAIDQMHSKGMIHRDISPDNIMVRGDGSVWLLDFGAAKDIEVSMGTESSAVVAKKGFSPSEQYSGKNIGPWTDVYALCATMYYCVSGRTLPDASERVQDDSIRWEPVQVPEDIRETIREGLSMRYSDRIQSVSELMGRLNGNEDEGVVPQKDTGAAEAGSGTELVTESGGGGYSVSIDPMAEETAKRKRGSLVKIAAAAAAVLLLACAAVFAFSRLGPDSTAEGPEESETVESTDAGEDAQESDDAGEDAQGDDNDESGPPEEDAEPGEMDGQEILEASDAPAPRETATATSAPRETATPAPAQQSAPASQNENYVTGRTFTTASTGLTYTYTGEMSGGRPNGNGTGVFAGLGTYTGAWKDGQREGTGTMDYFDGRKYVGGWKNDKTNGTGTATYTSGNKYAGEWKDNSIEGQGTYTWADGRTYEGSFSNGKMNGTGTYVSSGGDKYVGEWKDGKGNGTVTITYASGNKYVGQWQDGKLNGTGTYTYANGNKYEGQWQDSKQNGTGTFTYADGRKHVGEFKDGKYNGAGIYTDASGNKYEGTWVNGSLEGTVTITYANGTKYVGGWKENTRNGQGVQYNADGSVARSGTWANGEFVSSN